MDVARSDQQVYAEVRAALEERFGYEEDFALTQDGEVRRFRSVSRRVGRDLRWRIQTLQHQLSSETVRVFVVVHEVDEATADRMAAHRAGQMDAAVRAVSADLQPPGWRHLRPL